MNLQHELLVVVAALEAEQLNYAVCGGLAVAIHGFPRHTKDIDILIRESDLEAVKKVAASVGFDVESGLIRFQTGTPTEQRVYRLVKMEGTEHLMLDLILVTSMLEQTWSSRIRLMLNDQPMNVVSHGGLLMMKRLAGRPIDQIDLARLESEGMAE